MRLSFICDTSPSDFQTDENSAKMFSRYAFEMGIPVVAVGAGVEEVPVGGLVTESDT